MFIIDAHLDLAWNALQWNRDLRLSVYTTRTREALQAEKGRGQGTVALPELRQGRVALCFATLLARSTGTPVPHLDYLSPEQAFAVARGQLAYYRALEYEGHVRIIGDLPALERHIAMWEACDADASANTISAPPLGVVISMESADAILYPHDLAEWRQAGVRLIGPAHYGPGRYAGGTGTALGLTALGLELLVEMERRSIILDMTHLSDQAFWQALERYRPAACQSQQLPGACSASAPV